MVEFDKSGLTANLGCDVVVRQTGGREDGDLLTTSDRIHAIDGRDARLDHFLRVHARPRVDRLTLSEGVKGGEVERVGTESDVGWRGR